MTLVVMGKLNVNISGCSTIEKSVELGTGGRLFKEGKSKRNNFK